jgi:hypothetical protein
MKLLLDECIVQEFRLRLTGHQVFTVGYMGWSGVKNGKLLALAAAHYFDAFITTDKSVGDQQNRAKLSLAVVILRAASNDLDDLEPLVPALLRGLRRLKPKTVTYVGQTSRP